MLKESLEDTLDNIVIGGCCCCCCGDCKDSNDIFLCGMGGNGTLKLSLNDIWFEDKMDNLGLGYAACNVLGSMEVCSVDGIDLVRSSSSFL